MFSSVAEYLGGAELRAFPILRVEELEAAGKKSLTGRTALGDMKSVKHRREMFSEWRKNADAWHANRIKFMEEQFAKGRHPDTNKDFWVGYAEVRKPTIPRPDLGWFHNLGRSGGAVVRFLFAVAIGALGVALLLKLRRRLART